MTEQPLIDIWRGALRAVRADHVNGRFEQEPCRSCRINAVAFRMPSGTRQSIMRQTRRRRLLHGIVPASLLPAAARRRRFDRESPFGFLDAPRLNACVGGMIQVQGWALAAPGRAIARAEIHLDRRPVGCAELGSLRPDVGEAHPGEGHSFSGFTHSLDTHGLNNGAHVLDVRLIDDAARRVDLGARTIIVAN